MISIKQVIFPLFLIAVVSSRNVDDQDGRYINSGVYTKRVMEEKVVTSIVPSSCLLVEPTLAPCSKRTLKYFRFPTFGSDPQDNATTTKLPSNETSATALSWGEYLGIYKPTVTVTERRIITTTVQDPGTVVTFSILGCRPVNLPGDIPSCVQPTSVNQVLATKTVGGNDESTDVEQSTEDQLQVGNQDLVESSVGLAEVNDNHVMQPTEALP